MHVQSKDLSTVLIFECTRTRTRTGLSTMYERAVGFTPQICPYEPAADWYPPMHPKIDRYNT
jgi:hypothetical protein